MLRRHRFIRQSLFTLVVLLLLQGCAATYLDRSYRGPPPRPRELLNYYATPKSYGAFTSEIVETTDDYTLVRHEIATEAGTAMVSYYSRATFSDSLIFVFPLLGGKRAQIEKHFAQYFARHGFDTAIVERNNDFKDPKNADRLEALFRDTVRRDRVVMDFFEGEYGKKRFGSFGISRGAINASMTAGVDPRLEHNVLLLGGSDLVNMFKRSDQRRIRTFAATASLDRGISVNEFYDKLRGELVTDPRMLAPYINAKNTLLILATFDATVPFKYGRQLRREIGNPETVFLPANHYTALLYMQFPSFFGPLRDADLFPLNYMESESLSFYRRRFNIRKVTWAALPFRILRIPFDIVAGVADYFMEHDPPSGPPPFPK